jgi:hypothetical protein
MKKRLPATGKTKSKKSDAKSLAKRAAKIPDDELSAAVEAYENSAEGRAAKKHKPESRRAQLTKLFYQTPEGQEVRLTADSINNKLNMGDTLPIKIDVPKEFIRLTEFLEKKRMTGGRGKPRPAAKILNQILLNELHDQLHWLVVGPARYEFYRDLWNRFCDAQGAPEHKIADPASAPAESTEEGPF